MRRFYCPKHLLSKSLSEHVYLVSGASRGLGRTLVEQLLHQGAIVHGISRSKPDIEHVNFHWHTVDLSDLQQVHAFCMNWIEEHPRLDGLINNAAVIPETLSKAKTGMELQWTVNFLSAVVMTHQLLPSLQKSNGRVVYVSSTAHHSVHGRLGAINFEDIHCTKRPYDKWSAYAQSKLALTIYARQIAHEYQKVPSVSVHPGWVATTIAPSRLPSWLHGLLKPLLRRKGLCTEREGIQPMLAALLLPREDIHSGEMLCQIGYYDGISSGGRQHLGWLLPSPNPIVYDTIISEQLRTYTERQIEQTLDWAH